MGRSKQLATIIESAPSTLDTLNELAAALGDDANFSTTVTNSIATKLPLAGGTVTGDTGFTAHASVGVNAVDSTRALTVAGATDGSGSSIIVAYNSSLASKFAIRDDGLVTIAGDTTVGGKVGIGTTGPTHMLEVKSSGNAGQDFIKVLDSDNNQQFRIYSDSSTGEPVLRLYDTSGSAKIVLHSNGDSRFEGGNVGIGTNPASWARLDILGSGGAQNGANQAMQIKAPSATPGEGVGIRLSATSGSHEAVGIIGMVNNASGNAGAMTFHTYNLGATIDEQMRIDNEGNVGIGLTPTDYLTSGYNLRLYGGTQTYLAFNNSTHTTQVLGGFVIGNDSGAARITQRENQPIIIATNDINRMTIDSSGRLILGPDAQDIQIDPASTNSGINLLYMRGNASGDKAEISLNHYGYHNYHIGAGLVGNGKFSIGTAQTANSFVMDTSGNVGIGDTSPGKKLAVNGTGSFVAGFNTTGLTITGGTTLQNKGKIKLEGAGTGCDHIQIVNDGNSFIVGVERSAGTAIMGGTYGYASVIGSVTNNPLHFGVNNTTKMTLEYDGSLFFPERSTYGDMTFPICSVSNAGSSNRYLHVQFQGTGGDMLHIKFTGYEYIGSAIKEGVGGGYIYNTGGQNAIYAEAKSGDCVSVYQNTSNRVELVIDTGTSQVGNRWGSYIFYGGTDTITSNSPLKLIQYSWTSSTAKVYY